MATPSIDANQCAEMIAHVANNACSGAPLATQAATDVPPATTGAPNLDALAVAVTEQGAAVSSQANAISIVALFLGVIGVIVAIGWGLLVRRWAERLAADRVREWMEERVPALVANEVARLLPPLVEGRSPPQDQERGLGEERP
jgi:cellobiose-specific phosphotransferase system component IIC